MIYKKIKFGSKYQANIYIDNNGTLEGEERYIRNLVKEKPLVDLWTGKYRTG
ncbi:MAG: hypothetical protein M1312_00730 [Patescibacteria group bacterium]|nr:hypothetical protein [Patescibacteria group bacterium]